MVIRITYKRDKHGKITLHQTTAKMTKAEKLATKLKPQDIKQPKRKKK